MRNIIEKIEKLEAWWPSLSSPEIGQACSLVHSKFGLKPFGWIKTHHVTSLKEKEQPCYVTVVPYDELWLTSSFAEYVVNEPL